MDGERKHNPADFPEAMKVLAHYRTLFGPETKLIYVEENGQKLGKKFEDRVREDNDAGQ